MQQTNLSLRNDLQLIVQLIHVFGAQHHHRCVSLFLMGSPRRVHASYAKRTRPEKEENEDKFLVN